MRKRIKKTTIIFAVSILIFSCQTDRERQEDEMNKKSLEIFNSAISEILDSKINLDSIENIYSQTKKDSSELGLEFANELKKYTVKFKMKTIAIADSLKKIEQENFERKNTIAKNIWFSSKAGKIQKKHPSWKKEECKKIANREIWIGMTYKMLVYERGNPNTLNPSNYGKGTEYQCCWDDYTPSCFYMKEDDIIYAYN
jgi:hypothetical protein